MTDKNSDQQGDKARTDRPDSDEAMHEHDKGGEWLRDQTGEDHNLSGSSTYRTLPDQPGTGSTSNDRDKRDDRDDRDDRQSNR